MLNNPFFCTENPELEKEAGRLMSAVAADSGLESFFKTGKMLGVMIARRPSGDRCTLYAYSGQPPCGGGFPEMGPDEGSCGSMGVGAGSGASMGSGAGSGVCAGLGSGAGACAGSGAVRFVPPIFRFEASEINSSSAEESRRLQKWLFSQYRVHNVLGEERSILEVFAAEGAVPPSGTGDCAAPKLLEYAFRNHLEPILIGEFWYGASTSGEIRRHGAFYPSCTGKCGPLLRFMLKGLEVPPSPLEDDLLWHLEEPVIRYEDTTLVVAEKPSGMLAVPGRIKGRISLQEWLSERLGTPVFSCHRLDMETSGLILMAKSREAEALLRAQFENRQVQKAYRARLVAGSSPLPTGDCGKINLPISTDWYDRPRQKIDFEKGRPAVTSYKVLQYRDDGCCDVELIPFTGRTHQLRVHCASPLGLGRPILGDRLYGGISGAGLASCAAPGRLMLHASRLVFRHCRDGRTMRFESGFPANNPTAP